MTDSEMPPARKPPPPAPDTFLIRLAALVVAALVLLIAFSLFSGVLTVPENVTVALWAGVVVLIGIVVSAVGAFVTTRSNAATREHNERTAMALQASIHQTALDTQDRVIAVSTELNDGLQKEFGKAAAKAVKEDSDATAAALAQTNLLRDAQQLAHLIEADARRKADVILQAAETQAAQAALATKIDTVAATVQDGLSVALATAPPGPPALQTTIDANTEALGASTEAIDANTKRMLP